MTDINRSALMPYSASFMYQIVNNVEAYPDFLPWCGDVKVHHQDRTSMEASILMKKGKLNHWFKTRNLMRPDQSIEMTLLDGPFKKLHGYWHFTPIAESGSKIELALNFEMGKSLALIFIGPIFTQIANSMVDSFCRRAEALNEP
ncbi:MAG: type II toxin-antitoxin system RatA family toxin [Gammaproteobacteria bacterium]|nr:MAG: type II toxin-antitoxin system RatA family toxin [Gammaproteobacteria bacterium]